jgi:formylglycine-generating enzyme required for sulfatase activity
MPSPTDAISAFGVVFATTPNPSLATGTLLPATTAQGSFSVVASGLLQGNPYFARAYATTSSGTDYGAEIRFQTEPDPSTPVGFALIPRGEFQMGDALDGIADAPVRQVTVSAFYMAKHETTKALWDEVRNWGTSRGYTDLPVGDGKAANHPVHTVSWFDIIKWCNARSEKEGLTPVYYTEDGAAMRKGYAEPSADWSANGYRLPTEAEWEKAARGRLNGKRFPWGDTITHSQVNYVSEGAYFYDISPTRGFHPAYDEGNQPYTSPVGSFAANGYGLHDMAGNVWEWCWDWIGTPDTASATDPRGVSSGRYRVSRGGGWRYGATYCRVTIRYGNYYFPSDTNDLIGFRVARSSVPTTDQFVPTVITVAAVAGSGFDMFTVSGEVKNDGGTPVTSRGIVYSLTAAPTLGAAMDAPSTGAGTGVFSSTLTGLAPDTTYYARAYANSTVGTGYGADITFKTAPATPVGFSLIPAGVFQMGDSFGEGKADERPLRQVTVSAFYMAQQETTKSLWDEIRAWGVSRGYTDLPVGGGKEATHPVQEVNWFDVIKWCNARSEKDGLEPCYRVGGNIMRTGTAEPTVKWAARGYRLPTEAEWEKAARGGLDGKRFPWGDTISHTRANYNSDSDGFYIYDVTPTRGFHPQYAVGAMPYTSPVGSFTPNGNGLYDMTGNVWEWCWDRYGSYEAGAQTDPKGATSGSSRVVRGGSWGDEAIYGRVTFRYGLHPSDWYNYWGFRSARGL